MDSGTTAVLPPPDSLSRPGRLDAVRRLPTAAARVLRRAEFWLVLVLAGLTFVVHDVPYLLRWPFWTDESWVAVTTRFPLGKLPAVTSSTPIGWSLLLRAFTVGGQQWLRLLPLCFAALTVVIAYLFGRGLGWRDRRIAVVAGTLAAVAALMVPAMVIRGDLKQYTADACLAVAVIAVVSRLERDWSRRRLVELIAVSAGGMLLSHTTLFVGAAAFAAIVVMQLLRRAWARVLEAVVAGVVAGAGMLAVYVVFDARAVVPGLTGYWNDFYIPLRHPRASARFLRHGIGVLHPYINLGPTWLIAILALLGLVALVRTGRPAVALALALLGPELVAASGLKKYPLLDERTSTFLMVLAVVLAAVGVAWLCALLANPDRERTWTARNLSAAVLATAAATVFVVTARGSIHTHSLPEENVRGQADYVYAHRSANDVVLVNMDSNWGFAYYWPQGTASQRKNSNVLQGYEAVFPGQPQIVVASGRGTTEIDDAVDRAFIRAKAYPGSKIWFVCAHADQPQLDKWYAAFQADGLVAQSVDSGSGLSVITVTGG